MANSSTIQVLEDGPKHLVVKFEGVLDTSDIAATGTLGTAATGATTLNSNTISFTAGGLQPMQGQYVTGTGIPAGAYIVSFNTTTAVLSAVATATGASLTFTLVAGAIVIADPALVSYIDPAKEAKATRFVLNKLIHNVEDLLSVNLFWDATVPVRIEEIVGRGKADYQRFGGIKNNAGTYDTGGNFTGNAGFTGRVVATTQGWSTGILSFSLILEFKKSL
jgi:hypothetical protein